ncbi:MAG: hypothetical protein Q8Q63_04985, partial [Phaeovulum sp.]|uniref:hypothetical protein n=1 Tax=Phaeovulum sp. TaxID=2934796 RepID=UPI002736996C
RYGFVLAVNRGLILAGIVHFRGNEKFRTNSLNTLKYKDKHSNSRYRQGLRSSRGGDTAPESVRICRFFWLCR